MNPREALSPGLDLRDRHARPTCATCSADNLNVPAAPLQARRPMAVGRSASSIDDRLRLAPLGLFRWPRRHRSIRTRNNPLDPPRPPARRVAARRGCARFACDDMRVLIVCRGPVRKEAIEVFREMGMTDVGMLLSEKDSIVYRARALARSCASWIRSHVHRVPDYSGADQGGARGAHPADHRDLPRRTATTTSSPATASWPRTRDFVRASRRPASLHRPRLVHAGGGRRQGRGQTHRDREPGIGHPRHQQRHRAHAAAQVSRPRQRCGSAPSSIASTCRRSTGDGDLGGRWPKRCSTPRTTRTSTSSRSTSWRPRSSDEAARLITENPGRRFRLKAIGGGGGKGQRIFSEADGRAGPGA